jgi:two-component system OmpR family sensor kinase
VTATRGNAGKQRRRFRGLRVRLTALFTLATLALVVSGGIVFSVVLHRSIQANLDAQLIVRANSLADEVRSEEPQTPSRSSAFTRATSSLSQVYDPAGTVIASDPSELSNLLTAEQLAAAKTARSFINTEREHRRLRLVVLPVTRDDGIWVVVEGTSLTQAEDDAGDIDQAIWLAAPVMVLVAAVAIWVLSGAALRPVERMRSEAAALSAHDDGHRLTVPGTGDEIEALGVTLNQLLDRLHSSLAQQQEFVADASHELRTPLAVLRTELELADRPSRTRDDLLDSVRHAIGEVDRLSVLANSLLLLAHADSNPNDRATERVDLSSLLDDAIRAQRSVVAGHAIELVGNYLGHVEADLDSEAIRRSVDNLLANAVDHTPDGGTIEVEMGLADNDVVIAVRDTGPGFPVDFLPHAFERFTRADVARTRLDAHQSTGGLGLAIVATVVRGHGGTVTASNRPTGGAEIEMRIPRHAWTSRDR